MLDSRNPARSATLASKKMRMHKQCFITVVVLLTGCANYQPQPLTPQKMMAAYEERTLTNTELQRFITARLPKTTSAWGLSKLTLAAYYYSPELDAVRAKFASGEAATETANQRPNPSLSLPLQYADQPIKPWTYGLALDIPIETAGKRGYRVAQTQQLLRRGPPQYRSNRLADQESSSQRIARPLHLQPVPRDYRASGRYPAET